MFYSNRSLVSKVLLLASLVAMAPTAAQERFPGAEPSRETLKAQQKADELFEKGEFERSLFIYREDLAPIGDKYAQYMIGYMHLTGKGVPQDVMKATAWYRLAAERGGEAFVAARDEVMALLSDEQQEESDRILRELRQTYGDAAILSGLIESDIATLQRYTLSNPNVQRDLRQPFDHRREVYVPVAERMIKRVRALVEMNLSQYNVTSEEQDKVDELVMRARSELEKFASM